MAVGGWRRGEGSGGIRGVLAALRGNWGALEADFTRYYQTDLRAAVYAADPGRRWTFRRLRTHIEHLPPDSAYRRRLAGDTADWDLPTQLSALTVNLLGGVVSLLMASPYVDESKFTLPDLVATPWSKQPQASPKRKPKQLGDGVHIDADGVIVVSGKAGLRMVDVAFEAKEQLPS